MKLKLKKHEYPKIELYPYQIDHKNRMLEILKQFPFAIDMSMLGTGKTYTTCFLYQELGIKNIISINPVSVKSKWEYMKNTYGINLHNNISYCELRSVKFKQPKHGLLYRKDYTSKITNRDGSTTEIEKCEFKCTQEYLNLVNDGLLLVIDEIQNIKNMCDQLLACKELIRPIVEKFNDSCQSSTPICQSRVILLSGSPIDKIVQVVHLFKTLNIMNSDRLLVYNPQTQLTMWKGMNEIKQYVFKNCSGSDLINNIYHYNEHSYVNSVQLEKYCYSLFNVILKKYISNSMNPTNTISIVKNNAFYNINSNDKQLLIDGIKLLSKGTRFNPINHTIDFDHNGILTLLCIQRALIMIETAKINLFSRIAQNQLDKNPNTKVVICVNYLSTIDDLESLLSKYSPLRLDGSIISSKRGEIISKFQESNNNHRLLIGNLLVCSTGIDLDDQNGQYPRLCLVSPNYSTITLYQLSHRFARASTKSVATIHFVFGKDATELSILNALARKSTIMKEITEEQVKCGIIFPSDYTNWYEPDLD